VHFLDQPGFDLFVRADGPAAAVEIPSRGTPDDVVFSGESRF